MPNIPFLKVYCTPQLQEEVAELARLKGVSSAAVVREILEEAHLHERLLQARAQEAFRLASLQHAMASKAGQTDWIAGSNGKGAAARGHRAERREAGVRAAPRAKGAKARVKRPGARKRGRGR